jgi:putative cell wall-binding protein
VIPPDPLDVEPSYWGWASASTNVYSGGARWGGSAVGGVSWGKYVNGSDLAFVTYVQRPVTRLAGADRYATAVEISAATFPAGLPVVYVATGLAFPDALAGAAAAGHRGAPLLLVPGTGSTLPTSVADELTYLDPDRIVVLGGTGAVSPAIATKLRGYSPVVTRLSGPDRYATAVAISKWTYPKGNVEEVFIATGLAFPDALAAAAVAGRDDAPLLLVPGTAASLDGVPAVKAELVRLAPSKIVLAGGRGAVSAGIEAQVRQLLPTTEVTRISGADRYATAAAISTASFAAGGHPVAYVATGLNFPDALAGAALAGYDEAPLVLVPGTKGDLAPYDVIETELSRLGPHQIVIFGGPGAVSPGLAADLEAFVVP